MTTQWDELQVHSFALAKQIAAALPGWRAVPAEREYAWARVVRPDGAGVIVRMGDRSWGDGRVSLSPVWPVHADGRPYYTPRRFCPLRHSGIDWREGEKWTITVSAKRQPKAMAREIAQRLLPAYLVMYEIAVQEVAVTNQNTDEAEMVAHRLADVLGESVRPRERKTGEKVEIAAIFTRPLSRICVSPARPGSTVDVSFEVDSLDPETAAKVFAVIREAEQAKDAQRVRISHEAPELDQDEIEDETTTEAPRLRVNER